MEEYSITKEQKIEIDSKYRENKLVIFDFMHTNEADYDFILKEYEQNCKVAVCNIVKATRQKNTLEKGINSQIHMHINRLMGSKQREHELLLYDFLHKYYKSFYALSKSAK
jgi:lantibiotic biosynthesis protein